MTDPTIVRLKMWLRGSKHSSGQSKRTSRTSQSHRHTVSSQHEHEAVCITITPKNSQTLILNRVYFRKNGNDYEGDPNGFQPSYHASKKVNTEIWKQVLTDVQQ